jgi:hypothetical protein
LKLVRATTSGGLQTFYLELRMSSGAFKRLSFSRDEFRKLMLHPTAKVLSDTFKPHKRFDSDLLLRHVELAVFFEGSYVDEPTVTMTFVCCVDGRVRIESKLSDVE